MINNPNYLYSEGEIAITLSGRQTTPFPKVSFKSKSAATRTIKRVNKWLMENALEEAISKKDWFAELVFKHTQHAPSQGDKDGASMYLFGCW